MVDHEKYKEDLERENALLQAKLDEEAAAAKQKIALLESEAADIHHSNLATAKTETQALKEAMKKKQKTFQEHFKKVRITSLFTLIKQCQVIILDSTCLGCPGTRTKEKDVVE